MFMDPLAAPFVWLLQKQRQEWSFTHFWILMLQLLLLLPCSSSMTGCGKCGIAYTVMNKTEPLKSIASYCDLKLKTLMHINPAVNSRYSVVHKGQVLNISCSGSDIADCGPCGVRYFPAINETLSSISERCSIDGLYLKTVNIQGTKLDIPCGLSRFPKVLQCGVCGSSIHLLEGPASLENISQSCNVPLEEVWSLNPNLEKAVGNNTIVYLPCNNQTYGCGPCGAVYKVISGDTIEIIATKCLVSMSLVSEANPQLNIMTINIGQLLNIPCGPVLQAHASSTDLVKLSSRVIISAFLSFMLQGVFPV